MDSGGEIAYDFSPLIRGYKDGRVERLLGTAIVPPSVHALTGVQSKDVTIATDSTVAARLYIPKLTSSSSGDPPRKIPLLVYFHGGGFCIESAFSPTYHAFLNSAVAEANIAAVSVEYRRAPEHPLPAAFDDCWTSLKWVASHSDGGGDEAWLKDHADLRRVYLAGDSAGATIAHHITLRAGLSQTPISIKLQGIILIHPFFWGEEPIGAEGLDPAERALPAGLWRLACPASGGCDDPLINPAKDENLGRLGCGKVMVAVAEKDRLRERGLYYKELLEKSGWGGAAEVVEAEGEGHVFHLFNPDCENAATLRKKIAAFLNEEATQYPPS